MMAMERESVRLQHSKKNHILTEDGNQTLCGYDRSMISDGGDWWFTPERPTCNICISMALEARM